MAPSEYAEALNRRVPEALIVLAHWAILVHYSGDFWTLEEGGKFLIEGSTPTSAAIGSLGLFGRWESSFARARIWRSNKWSVARLSGCWKQLTILPPHHAYASLSTKHAQQKTIIMFENFQYCHIPALYTASAQLWGTIYTLIDRSGGCRNVLLHFGFPARIAEVPETWPVWTFGNARNVCLGLLMFTFYAQNHYRVLDIFLMVIGCGLGVADCLNLWCVDPKMAVFRLLGSLFIGVLGAAGVTQGGRRQYAG